VITLRTGFTGSLLALTLGACNVVLDVGGSLDAAAGAPSGAGASAALGGAGTAQAGAGGNTSGAAAAGAGGLDAGGLGAGGLGAGGLGAGGLGAGGAHHAERAPRCSDPAGLLLNGAFETEAAEGKTASWNAVDPIVEGVARASGEGRSGSHGLRLTKSSTGSPAPAVRQRINLAPFTPYVVRAWLRWDNVNADGSAPQRLAELSASPYFLAAVGPQAPYPTSSAWQELRLDFETGFNGAVDLTLQLNAVGTAVFDDVSIECNREVTRFESDHFILDLRDDQIQAATLAGARGVVARSEQTVLALADLTGQPAAPNGWRQAAWGPTWFAALAPDPALPGGAGYPFLWTAEPAQLAAWSRTDYVPESFLYALSENFEDPSWSFAIPNLPTPPTAFAQLKSYFAYSTLGLASVIGDTRVGERNRERYAGFDSAFWQERRCARQEALLYRDILIADRIGWDPFKAAYRALATESPSLGTAWERVARFHQVVAEASGRELSGAPAEVEADRALFTTTEWERVRAYYDRTIPTAAESPDTIALTTKTFSLSEATWQTNATVFHTLRRNTDPEGCPLTTEDAAHARGLFAHATSKLVFALGGQWQVFRSDFGLPAGVGGGHVRFEVLGDDQVLFASDEISDLRSHSLSVSVAGVQELTLRTLPTRLNGENQPDETRAWSMWLSPTLER
jgi:hypothetical protein